MSAMQPPTLIPYPRCLIPSDEDVRAVQDAFRAFEAGRLTAEEMRRFGPKYGVFGQRQSGVHMVRVKVPLGRLSSEQFRRLAAIHRGRANGPIHLTTRQGLQLYFVAPSDVPEVAARLAEAGLTTREGGGGVVRNITVCPFAGICGEENADVTPYAAALMRHLLRHPLCSGLPRVIKIGFSGCERDCAATGVHDIGFAALPVAPGQNAAFRMTVGGGQGGWPYPAMTLAEHIDGSEIVALTEAVLRVFQKYGERRKREHARLKFLIRRGMPFDEFLALVARERAQMPDVVPVVEASEVASFTPTLPRRSCPSSGVVTPAPGFDVWGARSAVAQKQTGFFAATVFVPKGGLTFAQMDALAAAADEWGIGELRLTNAQNVLLPYIAEANLPALHRALLHMGLAQPYANTAADVVSCSAMRSCRTAVRNATAMADRLSGILKPSVDRGDLESGASFRVSGCPHSCAHHHIAAIGLHGAAATAPDGRKVPCYQVYVGGGRTSAGAEAGDTTVALGRLLARVPVCRVTALVERLLALHRANRTGDTETLEAFLRRAPVAWLRENLADLLALSPLPGEDEATFFSDL